MPWSLLIFSIFQRPSGNISGIRWPWPVVRFDAGCVYQHTPCGQSEAVESADPGHSGSCQRHAPLLQHGISTLERYAMLTEAGLVIFYLCALINLKIRDKHPHNWEISGKAYLLCLLNAASYNVNFWRFFKRNVIIIHRTWNKFASGIEYSLNKLRHKHSSSNIRISFNL